MVLAQYTRCTAAVNRANASMRYCPSAGPALGQYWRCVMAQYRHAVLPQCWASIGPVLALCTGTAVYYPVPACCIGPVLAQKFGRSDILITPRFHDLAFD